MEGYLVSSKYTERLQIGLTYEQMEFVQSKSWDNNQAMSQYIRRLIEQDMEKEDLSYDTPDL